MPTTEMSKRLELYSARERRFSWVCALMVVSCLVGTLAILIGATQQLAHVAIAGGIWLVGSYFGAKRAWTVARYWSRRYWQEALYLEREP